jgi:hypothetical protein
VRTVVVILFAGGRTDSAARLLESSIQALCRCYRDATLVFVKCL